MRKIFMIMALFACTAANAHVLTPNCWSNGRFYFTATNLPNGPTRVQVLNTTYDTIINVVGNSLNFSVPQPIRTNPVHVKVKWSDNQVSTKWTLTNACYVTPIRFSSIKAQKISPTEVKVIFSVAEASGVNVYHIKISFDGIHYVDRAIIFTEDVYTEKIYSITIKL